MSLPATETDFASFGVCLLVVVVSGLWWRLGLLIWACFLPSFALAVGWEMVAAKFLVIWIVLIDGPSFGLTRPNLVVLVWFCTFFVFFPFWIEKCLSYQFCIQKMEGFAQKIV